MKSQDVGVYQVEPRWPAAPAPLAPAHLGCELKSMFDNIAAAPLPDRLAQLADALEEAFRRGDLGGLGRDS